MKKLFLSFFTLALSVNLFAQDAIKSSNIAVDQLMEKFVEVLKLNQSQLAKVQKIKERKQSQLEEIASLKESNSEAYYNKLEGIIKGNKISFQMLLNKQQLKEFDVLTRELRIARAAKYKALKNEGLSRIEIERVLLEMDVK